MIKYILNLGKLDIKVCLEYKPGYLRMHEWLVYMLILYVSDWANPLSRNDRAISSIKRYGMVHMTPYNTCKKKLPWLTWHQSVTQCKAQFFQHQQNSKHSSISIYSRSRVERHVAVCLLNVYILCVHTWWRCRALQVCVRAVPVLLAEDSEFGHLPCCRSRVLEPRWRGQMD